MWSSKSLQASFRASRRRLFSFEIALAVSTSGLLLLQLERRERERLENNERPSEDDATYYSPAIVASSLLQSNSCWLPSFSQCQADLSMPQHALEKDTDTTATTATKLMVRRRHTFRQLDNQAVVGVSLEDKYDVQWSEPLGEGSFGIVYSATDRATGEPVAIKKISQKFTLQQEFDQEMNALLHLRHFGGHPHICSLHEHFGSEDSRFYYLVLDLISGGELFDHLVQQGAYSEADAARLVREVASALCFLHGVGLTHGDMKPENLMLSTANASDAVIKVVDFGCAQIDPTAVIGGEDEDDDNLDAIDTTSDSKNDPLAGRTLAYCPPEVLLQDNCNDEHMSPAMDMWALGVILYIMLTGLHPYDLTGQATDDEVAEAVKNGRPPPLRNSPITAHLSDSAIDLMERLMEANPSKRISALEMLENMWVKGETANRSKMVDSDKKLATYRKYKSGIERTVFENIVAWSDNVDSDAVSKRASLIERSFRSFDSQQKGFITQKDLQNLAPQSATTETNGPSDAAPDDPESMSLSLSGFSDLLAENMKNRHFPKDHVVYQQGNIGNHMYFINSGTIIVETAGGTSVQRGPGDFFGEGALLHPKKIRSATIRCKTPVHAMEISREYFEKYLAKSDSGLLLTLREKDKIRKRNRTKMILRLQKNLQQRKYNNGDYIFQKGEEGDLLYIVENGRVDIVEGDNLVFTATPGNIFGEFSVISSRPRNCTAICASETGCTVNEMSGRNFRKLTEVSPDILASLRELCLRRDFKKAVVLRLKKEFPYLNPREAFDAVKTSECSGDNLSVKAVGKLMRDMNPDYTEEEIIEIVRTLALTNSGAVITYDEFKKVFIADIRTSASI